MNYAKFGIVVSYKKVLTKKHMSFKLIINIDEGFLVSYCFFHPAIGMYAG